MKFAVNFQATEPTCATFGQLARKCEDLGFGTVFINEHVAIPAGAKTPYPITKGEIPEYYFHFPDPFVCLAVAAAHTTTIEIGTGVSLTPEHDPIVLAKTLATLDVVSGGRLVYGAGAGWLREEVELLARVPFKHRWPKAIECLRAMKELWTRDEASFDGEFIKFPPVRSYPKPVQKPHVPIYIGAGGFAPTCNEALRNTVAVGDGWMPTTMTPERIKRELATLRRMCDAAERDFDALVITCNAWPAPQDKATARALAEQYEEAGVHRLISGVSGSEADPNGRLERIAEFYLS